MEDYQSLLAPQSQSSFKRRHDEGDHLLVFEEGGFTYLSVPPLPSESVDEEGKLCFLDHQVESYDSLSEICCLREAGHVHAHVHHGEITEDILLEQCMEEAGCTLPVPWDLGSMRTLVASGDEPDSDHEHQDGCGHNKIAHGDHFDWLIPLKDGSYVLSHAQVTANGGSQFIEHGRLVKVGESLGQLKKRPKQLVDLFTYVVPKRKGGYESLPTTEEDVSRRPDVDIVAVVKSPSHGCIALSSPELAPLDDDVKVSIPRAFKSQGTTKTTLDVLGICCPNEVPLVKKILGPLPGVDEVLVNVTAKTVTVLHDPTIVADVQLVKLLNEARLDASIHQRGKRRTSQRWPSPWTIGSGILLLISFLHYAWPPFKWVALGSVAVGVPPILIRSLVALRRCVLDINALMIIAVGGAIALGDYAEAGSIAFLFTLADWLEARSSDRARDAITNVADLAPQTAVLMDGQRVGVEDVSIGTLLAVKAGELIPIDGEVVSGKSSIDESNVTGESKPVEKATGEVVWAGTMNLSGYISMKTTALAEDSAVSRMVRLVEEAQNQHSPTEQLVEKIAKYYTPLVVLSALLIAVIPWAAGSHRHKHWVYLALVLLVVACPCALVISTPVTTTCGIAQAARSGLLVRGGSYLEALAKVKIVAMDKTGTLTEGHFRVLDVHSVNSSTSVQEVLYWLACVENKSSHPLAPALVSYGRLHGVEPTDDVVDFEIIPGLGVSAVVDGHNVQIGNKRLAESFAGFEDASDPAIMEGWNNQGATIGWVGVDGRPVGVFAVADSVRSEAQEAVASIKKLGVRVVMLTGDCTAAATAVQRQIGDIEVHSELLPEHKVALVKELNETGVVAMVGDGINDAPALALADIGIAMGVAGSAVAMETADVALMTNDLGKLAVAIKLGKNVRKKIIQNVSVSFITKVTIIILAAAGFPSLWAAVIADVGTCLAVICNSMRLLHRKKGIVLPKFESEKHAHNHNHSVEHCLRETDVTGINGEHHHHHHQHEQQLHQELGKIENHHHHCNDQHHHHAHEELGDEIGDPHHHHNPSLRARFWPRGRHEHRKEKLEGGSDTSEQALTGAPSGNVRKAFQGATTTKSRKCCTSKGSESKCCSDVTVASSSGTCCANKQCESTSKAKACRPAYAVHDSAKSTMCCQSLGTENDSHNGYGTALDSSNCCSKTDVKAQASPLAGGGGDNKKCCTGQGGETKSCCSKKKLKAQTSPLAPGGSDNKKCCTGKGETKSCCAKTNLKAQTSPLAGGGSDNKKCCTGQGGETKSCCSKETLKAQTSLPSGGSETKNCSTGEGETKSCCSKTHLKAQTSPLVAGGSDSKKCCTGQGGAIKSCCSTKPLKAQTGPMPSGGSDNKTCCTGEGETKSCCSKTNLKTQTSPAAGGGSDDKKCCTGRAGETKFCSLKASPKVPTNPMAEGGSECCTGTTSKKKCHPIDWVSHLENDLHETVGFSDSCCGKATSGKIPSGGIYRKSEMECCLTDSSEYLLEKEGVLDHESCCALTNCSEKPLPCGGRSKSLKVESPSTISQVRTPGPGDATSNEIPPCGQWRCKSLDHSKCAKEALVHSPLRDLNSFTRPVSPLV